MPESSLTPTLGHSMIELSRSCEMFRRYRRDFKKVFFSINKDGQSPFRACLVAFAIIVLSDLAEFLLLSTSHFPSSLKGLGYFVLFLALLRPFIHAISFKGHK